MLRTKREILPKRDDPKTGSPRIEQHRSPEPEPDHSPGLRRIRNRNRTGPEKRVHRR